MAELLRFPLFPIPGFNAITVSRAHKPVAEGAAIIPGDFYPTSSFARRNKARM